MDRTELRALIRRSSQRLAQAGVASPATDARLLAENVLGTPLLAADGASADFPARYEALVRRREAREPLQHITGLMWFRGLELVGRPGVFIVRPETEIVAGAAIEAAREVAAAGPANVGHGAGAGDRAADGARPDGVPAGVPSGHGPGQPLVVDLCTGSGAIAAAVTTEVPTARVVAVELAPAALALAADNLARLAPSVALLAGDVTGSLGQVPALAALVGACDVVVSNPPYVPAGGVEDVETERYDPDLALYGGGADGLTVPRAVVTRAADLLAAGGVLVMEHDPGQAEALRQAALAVGFARAATGQDLTGRDRYLRAVR